jgi:hypothetical protein
MAAQEGKTYNQGHPVPFTRPGQGVVLLSNVLLFLMVFSPVWGVLVGGWALHELGTHVRQHVREWRMEHRDWERYEWERRPAGPTVWRIWPTPDRGARPFANERAATEF